MTTRVNIGKRLKENKLWKILPLFPKILESGVYFRAKSNKLYFSLLSCFICTLQRQLNIGRRGWRVVVRLSKLSITYSLIGWSGLSGISSCKHAGTDVAFVCRVHHFYLNFLSRSVYWRARIMIFLRLRFEFLLAI